MYASPSGDYSPLGSWMDRSQTGKKATKRLYDAKLGLVRNPIRVVAVEREAGNIHMTLYGVKTSDTHGPSAMPDEERNS
jgi:hypothetical protein